MNLQKERDVLKLSLYAFLLLWPNQCHVFATTLTKVLVQRKQMDDLTPGLRWTATLMFVSERKIL